MSAVRVPAPPPDAPGVWPAPKLIATLKARAALVGVALQVIDDDRGNPLFVLSRWSLTRQLHSVAEVEDFLRRIGGTKA